MPTKKKEALGEAAVPEVVRSQITDALLRQLINSFDAVLKMVQSVCYRVSIGETKSAAEILTAAAWHIDRLISLISDKVPSDMKEGLSYEELLDRASKLMKVEKDA